MEVRGSLCAHWVSAVRSHQVTSDWRRPFIFKQSFWEGEISPVGHFKQLNATAEFLLGFAPKETLEVTAAVARRPWVGPESPWLGHGEFWSPLPLTTPSAHSPFGCRRQEATWPQSPQWPHFHVPRIGGA